MTHSEPIPNSGDNTNDIDSALRAFIDAEKTEDMMFAEQDICIRQDENQMVGHLLDDGFPLLPEALDIRAQLGIESGLTELHDHLVARFDDLSNKIASTPGSSEDLEQDRQLVYLQYTLFGTIQRLAAAKGAQRSVLDYIQEQEDQLQEIGKLVTPDIADGFRQGREFAYNDRKKVEADVLMDQAIGEKMATRILLAVAPEFEGESLLPITAESREYMMMYRLKEEKTNDDRTDLKAYTIMARDILESKFSDTQKQHPDFEEFAYSLSSAIGRNLVAPKYTQGHSPEQLQNYALTVTAKIAEAAKIAPHIGLELAGVRSIYEEILSQLS